MAVSILGVREPVGLALTGAEVARPWALPSARVNERLAAGTAGRSKGSFEFPRPSAGIEELS